MITELDHFDNESYATSHYAEPFEICLFSLTYVASPFVSNLNHLPTTYCIPLNHGWLDQIALTVICNLAVFVFLLVMAALTLLQFNNDSILLF